MATRPKTGGRALGSPNKTAAERQAQAELIEAKRLAKVEARAAGAAKPKRRSPTYPTAEQIAAGKRFCPNCETVKPLAAFPVDPKNPRGYSGHCKPCKAARFVTRYQASEIVRERFAHKARNYNYGLTDVQFEKMLNEQGGRCKACNDLLLAKPYAINVDHCHDTGRIRGVLCRGCNQAIGWARESPDRLRALAAYLEADVASKVG